ncbi:winged helix-turn-helix domain-containing protein [Sphingomonas sp. MMS24-J13]|uniref:winged helix-turn-helix domain-containing protein n=1 Tax=Sphingomonas sp. MMS24-J13 TaxID=3238686 RepID=UPI00384F4178
MTAKLKLKAQLFAGEEIAIGPGKAALLEAIIEHGSISAAGRALGMSYRRAWLLVDVMNRCWGSPLVETTAGGAHGGGARVSAAGKTVLAAYRALEAKLAVTSGAAEELASLSAMLRA